MLASPASSTFCENPWTPPVVSFQASGSGLTGLSQAAESSSDDDEAHLTKKQLRMLKQRSRQRVSEFVPHLPVAATRGRGLT